LQTSAPLLIFPFPPAGSGFLGSPFNCTFNLYALTHSPKFFFLQIPLLIRAIQAQTRVRGAIGRALQQFSAGPPRLGKLITFRSPLFPAPSLQSRCRLAKDCVYRKKAKPPPIGLLQLPPPVDARFYIPQLSLGCRNFEIALFLLSPLEQPRLLPRSIPCSFRPLKNRNCPLFQIYSTTERNHLFFPLPSFPLFFPLHSTYGFSRSHRLLLL